MLTFIMLVIVMPVMGILAVVGIWNFFQYGHFYPIHDASTTTLVVDPSRSSAAKSIISEWNRLPVESRPAYDIEEAVDALDTKFGIYELNTHFHDGYYFNWECYEVASPRPWRNCRYQEYLDLHDSIQGVKKALEEREHAIALTAAQSGLDTAAALRVALQDEARIIRETTKELT